MADRLYNTLQLPMLGVGVTSAPIPHLLHIGDRALIPNLVAAPGCTVVPGDVTITTIRVTNTSLVPFAPQVMVWYIHSIARALGVIDPWAVPSINPFILTNSGGGGGGGSLEHIIASPPNGAVEGLVSDLGAGDTNNTLVMPAVFADLTTRKRGLYIPGQYAFGNEADVLIPDPQVLPGQSIYMWGDGPDQTLLAFTKTPDRTTGFFVDSTDVGGSLRLEDMAIQGSAVPGPALFNIVFLDPNYPGLAKAIIRRVHFNGTNAKCAAVLMNGPANAILEDCRFGPLMTRPIRSEEFDGARGTWDITRGYFDTDDFCIDFGTKPDVKVDDCDFFASRDVGAGSIGINSSNAPPGGGAVPLYYQIARSRFYTGVLWHLAKQGPYLAEYTRNTHTLGLAGIGQRNACPVTEIGSTFSSPAYPIWAHDAGFVLGQTAHNDGAKLYDVLVPGTSGNLGGPTGVGAVIPDPGSPDGLVWTFRAAGVLALNGTAFEASGVDYEACMDAGQNAGDDSLVRASLSTFSGTGLNNINRTPDSGSRIWQFNDATFENYSATPGATNCLFRGGENILNNCDMRRAPQGAGSHSIRVTGGVSRWNNVAFRDAAIVALADAEDSDVDLYVNGCYGIGYFVTPAAAGGHVLRVFGGENRCIGFATGDVSRIRSYVTPLTAKGADITAGAVGQLITLYENEYDVVDGGTANMIFTRGIIAGPFKFKAVGAYVLNMVAIGPQVTNFGFLKSVAPTPIGSTRTFIQDAVDKLFYEQ